MCTTNFVKCIQSVSRTFAQRGLILNNVISLNLFFRVLIAQNTKITTFY